MERTSKGGEGYEIWEFMENHKLYVSSCWFRFRLRIENSSFSVYSLILIALLYLFLNV